MQQLAASLAIRWLHHRKMVWQARVNKHLRECRVMYCTIPYDSIFGPAWWEMGGLHALPLSHYLPSPLELRRPLHPLPSKTSENATCPVLSVVASLKSKGLRLPSKFSRCWSFYSLTTGYFKTTSANMCAFVSSSSSSWIYLSWSTDKNCSLFNMKSKWNLTVYMCICAQPKLWAT